MQLADDVGPRRTEDLVAPLQRGAAEVVGVELGELEIGPGGPVEDDGATLDRREVRILVGSHPQRLGPASLHTAKRLLARRR